MCKRVMPLFRNKSSSLFPECLRPKHEFYDHVYIVNLLKQKPATATVWSHCSPLLTVTSDAGDVFKKLSPGCFYKITLEYRKYSQYI